MVVAMAVAVIMGLEGTMMVATQDPKDHNVDTQAENCCYEHYCTTSDHLELPRGGQ